MSVDERKYYWVYGMDFCPYCTQAKELILAHGHQCIYIDVTNRPELRDPNWKTVPQIFELGRYIGGYAELEKELTLVRQ